MTPMRMKNNSSSAYIIIYYPDLIRHQLSKEIIYSLYSIIYFTKCHLNYYYRFLSVAVTNTICIDCASFLLAELFFTISFSFFVSSISIHTNYKLWNGIALIIHPLFAVLPQKIASFLQQHCTCCFHQDHYCPKVMPERSNRRLKQRMNPQMK